MTSNSIKNAMQAVIDAHAVLEAFHQEVVALFDVADTVLQGDDVDITFESIQDRHILSGSPGGVPVTPGKLDQPQSWVPGWWGRSYIDGSRMGEETDPVNFSGIGARKIAFMWVGVRDSEIDDFRLPECWIGTANPILSNEEVRSHDASRAVWGHLEGKNFSLTDWTTGEFPKGKYGFHSTGGGQWATKRIPLAELFDEDAIIQKIVNPLAERFTKDFG